MTLALKYHYISPYILEIIWPPKISKEILLDILEMKAAINSRWENELWDMKMGYHNLSLHFKAAINFSALLNEIEDLQATPMASASTRKRWFIPVCYNLDHGKDLGSLAQTHKMEPDEVIKLHQSADYLLYFYGFLPGFMYLGGLPEKLFTPRKPIPDRKIEKGSVAIGGGQTGIYPQDSPGGWWVIGKTPLDMFNLQARNPVFAQPGDEIRFEAIEPDAFHLLREQILAGKYAPKNEIIHG